MLLQSDGTPYPDAALTPAAFSPYFATQESNSRRELWTFRDDTRRQLTASSLQVLRLKSRTLIANYGPANALDYLSWMVGPLKPQSISGDASWSELAEEAFQRIAMSPRIFDASGRINFAQAQVRICLFHPWSDGDAFSILTETESGSARVAMREGHQVAQPPEADAVWNNGVKVTGDNFPLAYWFPAQDGSGKGRALPSSAVHHHARFTTLGATRGTPILAHAINHFHDIIETNGFVKQAIKQAALMGLTRLSDSTGNGTPSLHGLGAPLSTDVFSPPGSASPGGAAPPAERYTVENILGGGMAASVPLDVLHDDRPHPNQQAFKESLLREVAIGLGVPPEVLYFMDSPGGADIRFKIEVLARFILNCHRDHILPFCQRFWVYAISKEMKAGRLPYPSKGDFWRVRWTPQRDVSVDLGKMGRLLIEMRKSLLTTHARVYEGLGLDYEEELRQAAKEERMLMDLEKEYGLPPGRLTEKLSSSAGANVSHLPDSAEKAA